MPKISTIFYISLILTSCRTTESDLESGPRRIEFTPGDISEFNPAHYEGPFTVAGEWDFDTTALDKHYGGLKPSLFGSLALSLAPGIPLISRATGRIKYIRELHYRLSETQIGIRPIPIIDRKGPPESSDPDYPQPKSLYWKNYPPEGKAADGSTVRGSEILDQLLRKEYGFSPSDATAPLFAIYGLTHPELFEMEFSQLSNLNFLKTENSMTHLGAYIGAGQTRNSPASYGALRWEILHSARRKPLGRVNVSGYPANIYIVRPKSPTTDVRAFLNNILITLRLLNELNDGPTFPEDYKFDWVHAINLEETLAFYRAWIDPTWKRFAQDDKPYLDKIKEQNLYKSYCAEHVTIVLNVAMNLVQNEQGYIDVWGASDGRKLWQLAKQRYENRERLVHIGEGVFMTKELGPNSNSTMPKIEPKALVPLWKTRGIRSPVKETRLSESLVYPLVTNADLIAAFLEQYAAWPDVGPVLSIGALMSFLPEAVKRTGIQREKFIELATGVATKMIKHDASAQPFEKTGNIETAYSTYLKLIENGDQQTPGLRQILAFSESTNPGFTESFIAKLMTTLKSSTMVRWLKNNHDKDINKEAWRDFLTDAKVDLDKARSIEVEIPQGTTIDRIDVSGTTIAEKNVKHYTPPAVIHRIAAGIYPYASDYLEIKAVATAMDASELRRASGDYRQYQVGM